MKSRGEGRGVKREDEVTAYPKREEEGRGKRREEGRGEMRVLEGRARKREEEGRETGDDDAQMQCSNAMQCKHAPSLKFSNTGVSEMAGGMDF